MIGIRELAANDAEDTRVLFVPSTLVEKVEFGSEHQ